MKKYIILISLFMPLLVSSQSISGIVFSENGKEKQPLPGVNIFWEGTTEGTASDAKGTFLIENFNGHHMLVFSFIGYEQKTVHINGQESLEVTLNPNLELEEVTVIEKDRGTYLSVINPIQTERIGGAELHKAACCNLAESFETNPSVDLSYSDAVTGAKQIKLLGLDGTYSLLQVENMPNLRGLATTFGLTYIPGPWLESIQVSKGAASVLNGYESIAGQINAELKKPDSQEKLFLNAYGSAHGRLEFNANGNIRFKNDKWTTGLFAHVSHLDKRTDENGDSFLDEPLSTRWQFGNRWKYNNKKGHMAQFGINFLTEDRLGGQVNFEKGMPMGPGNPYGVNIETNRYEGFFKTGYVFPEGKTAIALLSNFSRHETSSFYGTTDYLGDENRFYANLVVTRDLDNAGVHTLNAGTSYVYDDINEEIYSRKFSRKENVPGLFAEYTFKPSGDLTLMGGVRSDFHNEFGTLITPRMHFRYKLSDHFTFRTSAGKGFRSANVLAENIFLLANSRPLYFDSDMVQEEAWNYGAAFIQNYTLLERDLQINAEFYRTQFQTQLVVDRETSAEYVILAPLDGISYANSFQLDLRWQPIERLDMLLAYRVNDVKQTIGGELKEKPLTSKYKGLINLNYSTNLKKWMFNYTIQFNGGGRIPTIANGTIPMPEERFSPYTIMNAQVTKYFRYWNIYFGSENLTDFMQADPILGAEDPYGSNFDATRIWGPTMGRKIYLGLRFTLNYE